VAVVERAEAVKRFGQVAVGGLQVVRRQFEAPEVAQQRPYLEPVTGLTEQRQGLGRIAGRDRKVPRDVCGVRPCGQQAAGQVGLPEAAGQAQALLDERQRGTGLPLAQQDPSSLMQEIGDQVFIAGCGGDV